MADDERVKIIITNSPNAVIRMHPSLCRRLQLVSPQPLRMAHGELKFEIGYVPDASISENEIIVSRKVAEQLLLNKYPFPIYAHVNNRQLRVGPIVGILCNPVWNTAKQTMRSFGQLPSLNKLVQVGEANGAICYLFGLQKINFQNSTVSAYLLTRDGWKEHTLPMPDVIYDQIISRKIEQKEKWATVRKTLSKIYGDRIFNDGFFDKWQVHEWLSNEPKMKQHVLSTIRHTTTQNAVSFLQKYQMIFLKPVHGSLGVGIARFVRQSDGTFAFDLKQTTSSVTHGRAKNALEAVKTFEKRLSRKQYVWQEGITLLTYKERPFDIRILMQRDETGEWKRTKMFARVAKAGDFTSNISGGGEGLPIDDVLSEIYGSERVKQKCRRQIAQVSKLTVQTLEHESGKTYGELGIDIGLDKTGNVWIIEVNSKPRKSPKTEKGRQDLVDLSFKRPIVYAIRLAKNR